MNFASCHHCLYLATKALFLSKPSNLTTSWYGGGPPVKWLEHNTVVTTKTPTSFTTIHHPKLENFHFFQCYWGLSKNSKQTPFKTQCIHKENMYKFNFTNFLFKPSALPSSSSLKPMDLPNSWRTNGALKADLLPLLSRRTAANCFRISWLKWIAGIWKG